MQTQEQILEISQRYGVPTPETCKKLAWQEETAFYWVGLTHYKNGIKIVNYFLALRIPIHMEHQQNDTYILRENDIVVLCPSTPHIRTLNEVKDCYKAPQMHEFIPRFMSLLSKSYKEILQFFVDNDCNNTEDIAKLWQKMYNS